MEQCVLVTGGAGYIGSHLCKTLALHGYTPIVYDSFKTGHRSFVLWGPSIEGDVLDTSLLTATLKQFNPCAVFHLAADSHVRASILDPLVYYKNNLGGTLSLLQAMSFYPIPHLIFSSSASVYGNGDLQPLLETAPLNPTHPYGRTKLVAEQMIADFCKTKKIHYAILRYFNAAGADLEGKIGEMHNPETHLIPLLIQVLQGKKEAFQLFGKKHPTHDGTAKRDFVHVSDLAEGHVAALQWLQKFEGNLTLNFGSGKGHTILDVASLLEAKTNRKIPIIESHSLDEPTSLIAEITLAKEFLSWSPKLSSLDNILETALRWHL